MWGLAPGLVIGDREQFLRGNRGANVYAGGNVSGRALIQGRSGLLTMTMKGSRNHTHSRYCQQVCRRHRIKAMGLLTANLAECWEWIVRQLLKLSLIHI